jgi:hypothetical protein
MSEQHFHAEINNVVALLDRAAPHILQAARQRFPELAAELRPGVTLIPTERRAARARAELVHSGMQVAIQDCDVALNVALDRLSLGRKLRTVGRTLTLVGQSSVLGALGLSSPGVAVVAGVLALAASLGTLWAESVELTWGNGQSLEQLYVKLVSLRYDANNVRENLALALATLRVGDAASERLLAKLAKDGNLLCRQLFKLMPQLGSSPANGTVVASGNSGNSGDSTALAR